MVLKRKRPGRGEHAVGVRMGLPSAAENAPLLGTRYFSPLPCCMSGVAAVQPAGEL